MMRPSRGNVYVEPVETEQTLPGGRIIIPDGPREQLAAYQMRVVAVGEPEICDDPDECDRPHNVEGQHLLMWIIRPGAWVYVQPRNLIEVGPKLYTVPIDSVLGVFTVETPQG